MHWTPDADIATTLVPDALARVSRRRHGGFLLATLPPDHAKSITWHTHTYDSYRLLDLSGWRRGSLYGISSPLYLPAYAANFRTYYLIFYIRFAARILSTPCVYTVAQKACEGRADIDEGHGRHPGDVCVPSRQIYHRAPAMTLTFANSPLTWPSLVDRGSSAINH